MCEVTIAHNETVFRFSIFDMLHFCKNMLQTCSYFSGRFEVSVLLLLLHVLHIIDRNKAEKSRFSRVQDLLLKRRSIILVFMLHEGCTWLSKNNNFVPMICDLLQKTQV